MKSLTNVNDRQSQQMEVVCNNGQISYEPMFFGNKVIRASVLQKEHIMTARSHGD